MASINDKITDTRNGQRPNTTTVSSGRSAGASTLSCADLSGWPTASKVHFVTYQIDSNSNPILSTQLDCVGIVSSNDITSFTVIDGNDAGNSVGDVVEMLPTAAWGQDLADGFMKEHDRTGAHTAAAVATLKTAIVDVLYPVGSIYTNASVSTNPATLLGFGTWTAFGAGRVMVGKAGSGTFSSAGATGGEETHVLTTNEIPSHQHNIPTTSNPSNLGANDIAQANATGNPNTAIQTQATGGGAAHNNLQPYVVVYIWQRTA